VWPTIWGKGIAFKLGVPVLPYQAAGFGSPAALELNHGLHPLLLPARVKNQHNKQQSDTSTTVLWLPPWSNLSEIPLEWIDKLARKALLMEYAVKLLSAGTAV
jgi:hypothetical protein